MAKKKTFGVRAQLTEAAQKENSAEQTQVKEKKEKLLVKTYNYKEETLEIIKNIAYWERENIWEVIDKAVVEYAENYEKENGPIKQRKGK